MAALAKALRYKGPSSYQRYEDPDLYTKEHLPLQLTRALLEILVGKGSPPITKEEVMMLAGLESLSTPQMQVLDEHRVIWCIGEVAAGVWRDAFEWPRDEWLPVLMALPDERYKDVERHALRVSGDSMDLLYPDGSFVIFVQFAAIGRGPRGGERVIALRHRHGQTEATVKEYVKDGQKRRWLLAKSSNPRYAAIPLDSPRDDDDTTEVLGLVVGSQRIE